jgi:hypothetical protein
MVIIQQGAGRHKCRGFRGRNSRAIAQLLRPGKINWFQLTPEPHIEFRCITLHPSPNRRRIHRKVPFRHHLGQISITERISEVPTYAQDNHFIGEVPPPKQRWPISRHDFLRYQRRPPGLQQSRMKQSSGNFLLTGLSPSERSSSRQNVRLVSGKRKSQSLAEASAPT